MLSRVVFNRLGGARVTAWVIVSGGRVTGWVMVGAAVLPGCCGICDSELLGLFCSTIVELGLNNLGLPVTARGSKKLSCFLLALSQAREQNCQSPSDTKCCVKAVPQSPLPFI